MARLSIPERLKAPIASISSMSQETFDTFLKSLRTIAPTANPPTIVARIRELAYEKLLDVDLNVIIGAMFSLYQIRDVNGVSLSEFVEDLVEAINAATRPPSIDTNLFKQRIAILLDIPEIAVSAKGFSIQREQQKLFVGARAFSDIRPVFSEDAESLKAVVISHQLKISYVENDERHEIFLTLDGDDLTVFQKALTRAQTKSKSLASLVEKTGLINLS